MVVFCDARGLSVYCAHISNFNYACASLYGYYYDTEYNRTHKTQTNACANYNKHNFCTTSVVDVLPSLLCCTLLLSSLLCCTISKASVLCCTISTASVHTSYMLFSSLHSTYLRTVLFSCMRVCASSSSSCMLPVSLASFLKSHCNDNDSSATKKKRRGR